MADADSKFALKPSKEPAAIKKYAANSKGLKKHWVNASGGSYVVTFMTKFSASTMDDAMKRGCQTLCQKGRSDLEAAGVPVSMFIMRSADGYIIGAY